jgi:hypothetical protein
VALAPPVMGGGGMRWRRAHRCGGRKKKASEEGGGSRAVARKKKEMGKVWAGPSRVCGASSTPPSLVYKKIEELPCFLFSRRRA